MRKYVFESICTFLLLVGPLVTAVLGIMRFACGYDFTLFQMFLPLIIELGIIVIATAFSIIVIVLNSGKFDTPQK